jgi:uncharacterized membrane protein
VSGAGDGRPRGLGNSLGPPRFIAFLVLLPISFAVYLAIFPDHVWRDALAVSFDLSALAFLLLVIPLVKDRDPDEIRDHAKANDANRELVLIGTAIIIGAVLGVISSQLDPARDGDPVALAKLLATLAIAWLFANTVCMLHYAHVYYRAAPGGGDTGGLDFPETDKPTYLDFAYYAFTIGMTFQTSDVATTNRTIRSITLMHAAVAFVFNIGIIAFTINGIGG